MNKLINIHGFSPVDIYCLVKFMTDFENIISYENLYRAHLRARRSKRYKREVIEFEMNLSENLWNLHSDLKYGKYKVSSYNKFMIFDPKEREIQAISYRDSVVQHSLCDNYLMPMLEKRLIFDNGACRKNKGTHFVIKRFRSFLVKHYLRLKTFCIQIKIIANYNLYDINLSCIIVGFRLRFLIKII